MKAYKIIVSGKVQGVYYRKSIKEKALMYGFNGYIQNLTNGDVEVGVMLDNRNYNTFLKILQNGSPYSKVENLEVEEINGSFDSFIVRY